MSKFEENPGWGKIFHQENATGKQPGMTGTVKLDRESVEYILNCANRGVDPTLRIAAWEKQGNRGPFFSIKLSVDRPPSKGNFQQGNQPAPRQGGFQNQGYNQGGFQQGAPQNQGGFQNQGSSQQGRSSYANKDELPWDGGRQKDPWE